jgi:hypothetical protein
MPPTIYTGGAYRTGAQGYILAGPQSDILVPVDAVTDPTITTSPTFTVGLCRLPQWMQPEGMQPINTIGAQKAVSEVPGRREPVIDVDIQVSDASMFANANTSPSYAAIRNHDTPSTGSGLINGLQLLTLELGTSTAFGNAYGVSGVDALLNTLRLAFSETNVPVQAHAQFVAPVLLPVAPLTAVHPYPTGAASQPLIWQEMQWMCNDIDYKPILASVEINLNNNVGHGVGTRPMILSAGAEIGISRCAYQLLPGNETVEVRYTLHDNLPAALATTLNWGTVTLYAEQPGTGAGRCFLQIDILNNYLNRMGMGSVEAGQPITFTGESASFGINITAGLT